MRLHLLNNYSVKRTQPSEAFSNQLTAFLLSVSSVATMYLLPNVPFFGERALVQLVANPISLYLFATAYLSLSVALTLIIFDNTEEPESGNDNNLTIFGFVFYLVAAVAVTLAFLLLKLTFSYNSFLLGYSQSLFFFLFVFLSHFLFILFTKSFVMNNLINKLIL